MLRSSILVAVVACILAVYAPTVFPALFAALNGGGAPQPLASVTTTAVTTAADPATAPVRLPLSSTSPTVTSGHFPAGCATPGDNYDRL